MKMLNFIAAIYNAEATTKDILDSIVSDYNANDGAMSFTDEKLIMRYLDIEQLKRWKKVLKAYLKPAYIEKTGMASSLLEECRQYLNKSELTASKKLLVLSEFYDNEKRLRDDPTYTIEEYAKKTLADLQTRIHIVARFISLINIMDEEISKFEDGIRHNTTLISISDVKIKYIDLKADKVWMVHRKQPASSHYSLMGNIQVSFEEAVKSILDDADPSKIDHSDHHRYCILFDYKGSAEKRKKEYNDAK